ncbi:hypothetical protein RAM80_25600 [Pseudomonas sp. App30]|uniref:hypothetical protein n=1 Tax=Pseudomonas sp. App30 TaxID=3068990 RepID=UPI003A7FF75C
MTLATIETVYCIFTLWLLIHAACLYTFSYKNVVALEKILETSQWVQENKRHWPSNGFFDLTFRVGCINTLLCFPKRCHAQGMVNVADLVKIPRRQRLVLMTIFNTGYLGLLAMGCWAIFVHYAN